MEERLAAIRTLGQLIDKMIDASMERDTEMGTVILVAIAHVVHKISPDLPMETVIKTFNLGLMSTTAIKVVK